MRSISLDKIELNLNCYFNLFRLYYYNTVSLVDPPFGKWQIMAN